MTEFVTITTPDGQKVRFPKGMSRQEMADALNKLPSQQREKPGFFSRENWLPDDDPNHHNTGEKIAATINKAGEALTFGLIGDEADAWVKSKLGGGTYDEELAKNRQQEAVLERDNPGLALSADIGGGVLGALLPLGTIGTVARGGRMAKLGASAAAGAGMGGTYGFMEGEGKGDRIDQMQSGMLIGGAAGAAAPAIGAGVNKVANALIQRGPIRRAVRSAQTAAEQRGASRDAYRAFNTADAQMSLPAFRRMTEQVDEAMRSVEPSPTIPGPLGKPSKSYSKITKSLRGMDDAATQATQAVGADPAATGIRLSSVEDVRKAIGPLSREVNERFRPTPGAVSAMRATDAIDAAIDNLQPEDLVAGDRDAAVSALKKARDLWRRSIKTQKVENAIEAADDYLSGSASGIRNQFKSLLRRDRKEKLFTEAERAFLKKAIGGNMLSRAVRLVGDGIGRRAAFFMGGGMGGPAGAAIGAGAGELAAQIGDSAAMKNAEIARALVASGALQNLPQSPESVRLITEALARRIGAVAPQ